MAKHYRPVQTTPFFYKTKSMPSTRRIKVFGVLILLFIITFLFWNSSANRAEDPRSIGDFYAKTVNGLNKKIDDAAAAASGAEDEEVAMQMASRLKEAAQIAKDKTNAKAPKPDPPSAVVGKGSAAEGAGGDRTVAGRKKMSGGDVQVPIEESMEDHEVTEELNSILKKSPSEYFLYASSFYPFFETIDQMFCHQSSFSPNLIVHIRRGRRIFYCNRTSLILRPSSSNSINILSVSNYKQGSGSSQAGGRCRTHSSMESASVEGTM